MKSLKYSLFLFIVFFFQCKMVEGPFELVETAGPASCSVFHVVGQNGEKLSLPSYINEGLDCPSILSLEGDFLIVSSSRDIILYNLKTDEDLILFIVNGEMDGYSDILWSADKSSLLFAMIDQQKRYDFKESVRLVRIELSGIKVKSTYTVDRPVNYHCGSMCYSEGGKDFKFDADKNILYRRNENIQERPGVWETITFK